MVNEGQRGHLPLLLLASLVLTFLTSSVLLVRAANLNLLYVSPAQQGPLPQGSIITYQVKVAKMDPFNAWDIEVETNPTVLNPVSLSITGNTLNANYSLSTFELANCVNGGDPNSLGPGSTGCDPSKGDGPGVVHSAVFPQGSPPPVSAVGGILFTITYRVVASNGLTGVLIFNDQIASAISNSTGTFGGIVRHKTEQGIYGNAKLPIVDFYWTPTQPALGQIVTFTSNSSDPNPGARIVSYIWNFGDGTGPHDYGASATWIYTARSGGTEENNTSIGPAFRFMVTLTIVDSLGLANLLTLQVLVPVPLPKPPPDFSLELLRRPPSSFSAGSKATAAVSLASLNNLMGTVSLSGSVSPPLLNAPVLSFNPATVVLGPNANESSTVTVSVSSLTVTVPGNYDVTVAGTFGLTVHSVSFSVTVVPFSIEAKPTDLVLQDGQSGRTVITLSSINGFAGTLRVSAACIGCKASLTRDTVNLSANGTARVLATISIANNTPAFSYELDISARTAESPFFTLEKIIPIDVPLLMPVFVRQGLAWEHHLSLSGTSSSQTWIAQVSNPNGGDPLVVNVHIVVTNSRASSSFTADSGPFLLKPGETRLNVTIAHFFNAPDLGLTFDFKATIQWELNVASISDVSSSIETGSFTIVG
jgi:hypothetical protein